MARMTTLTCTALATLLAMGTLPDRAAAQFSVLEEDDLSGPRFSITPFVAHLAAFDRAEDWLHDSEAGTASLRVIQEIAAGSGIGLNLEIPLAGRVGLMAGGLWGLRDRTVVDVADEGQQRIGGNKVLIGRAGLVLHLAQDPSELLLRGPRAAVYAGGAVMHEEPRNTAGALEFIDPARHYGINLGLMAELPFSGERFAVQAALEDNVIWWDTTPMATLAYEYLGRPGDPSLTTVATEVSHVWLLRAGLTIRLF